MPPTDDKSKFQQPNYDKAQDQTGKDLPPKDGSSSKDDDSVKGGRMKQRLDP